MSPLRPGSATNAGARRRLGPISTSTAISISMFATMSATTPSTRWTAATSRGSRGSATRATSSTGPTSATKISATDPSGRWPRRGGCLAPAIRRWAWRWPTSPTTVAPISMSPTTPPPTSCLSTRGGERMGGCNSASRQRSSDAPSTATAWRRRAWGSPWATTTTTAGSTFIRPTSTMSQTRSTATSGRAASRT